MIGPFARWREGRQEVYTIHEPPSVTSGARASPLDRAERLVFLKDGFSWAAFLLGPFWLAYHRIWIGLAAYAGVLLLASAVLSLMGAPQVWSMLVSLGLALFLGFEGSTLRSDKLAAQGWRMLGTVSGRNLAQCERRYFESWLTRQPAQTETAGTGPAGDPGALSAAMLAGWTHEKFAQVRDRLRARTH
jgi:hypothetical protein